MMDDNGLARLEGLRSDLAALQARKRVLAVRAGCNLIALRQFMDLDDQGVLGVEEMIQRVVAELYEVFGKGDGHWSQYEGEYFYLVSEIASAKERIAWDEQMLKENGEQA